MNRNHFPLLLAALAPIAVLLSGCGSVPTGYGPAQSPARAVEPPQIQAPGVAPPSHLPPPYAVMDQHPNSPSNNPWLHLPFADHEDHPAWWRVDSAPQVAPRSFVVKPSNAHYIAHPPNHDTMTRFDSKQAEIAYRNILATGRPH